MPLPGNLFALLDHTEFALLDAGVFDFDGLPRGLPARLYPLESLEQVSVEEMEGYVTSARNMTTVPIFTSAHVVPRVMDELERYAHVVEDMFTLRHNGDSPQVEASVEFLRIVREVLDEMRTHMYTPDQPTSYHRLFQTFVELGPSLPSRQDKRRHPNPHHRNFQGDEELVASAFYRTFFEGQQTVIITKDRDITDLCRQGMQEFTNGRAPVASPAECLYDHTVKVFRAKASSSHYERQFRSDDRSLLAKTF